MIMMTWGFRDFMTEITMTMIMIITIMTLRTKALDTY